MKALDLRSKANLPISGSSRAEEAVQRSRAAAKQVLEMKYPNTTPTEQQISKTCSLEIKYSAFCTDGKVTKSKDLNNLEVEF